MGTWRNTTTGQQSSLDPSHHGSSLTSSDWVFEEGPKNQDVATPPTSFPDTSADAQHYGELLGGRIGALMGGDKKVIAEEKKAASKVLMIILGFGWFLMSLVSLMSSLFWGVRERLGLGFSFFYILVAAGFIYLIQAKKTRIIFVCISLALLLFSLVR